MKHLFRTVLLLTLLGNLVPAAAAGIPATVDVRQAATLHKQGTLLLDVREPDEYAAVHAVDAVLIPLGELPTRLNELKKFKTSPSR